jgi:hypothetical protein
VIFSVRVTESTRLDEALERLFGAPFAVISPKMPLQARLMALKRYGAPDTVRRHSRRSASALLERHSAAGLLLMPVIVNNARCDGDIYFVCCCPEFLVDVQKRPAVS